MGRTAVLVLVCLLAPLAVLAEQPPIIDRSLFFGEVTIAGAQISPDGQYISFLKPYKGTRNLWVKKASEPFSAARPVSAERTRPVRQYFWSRDSKYLLYAQDVGGDENFNVYAIDPRLPPDPTTGVPPTRALTDLKGVRTELYAAPKTHPDILYIGLNNRDPRWHDLYSCTSRPASARCCARTRIRLRAGTSTMRARCGWRSAPTRRATPRSCGWTMAGSS